ncbi:MAG: HEAT repeat domain-containing protein [Planctomycetota bacterium]
MTALILLAALACPALGQGGDPRILPTGRLGPAQKSFLKEKVREFGDPEPDRRRALALQVAQAADAAVPFVLDAFQSSTNPLVVRTAILALGEIGTQTALEALSRQVLAGDLKDAEKSLALLILGQHSPCDLLESIRTAALSNRPSLLREASTLALGRLLDLEGVGAALEKLDREPLESRRVAVLVAAGVTGDRLFLPRIVPFLQDDAVDVRRAAAFALGETADAAMIRPLLESLRREQDATVLSALAIALGVLEDPGSAEALIGLAGSRDSAVRRMALVALASRPEGEAQIRAVLASSLDPELLTEVALATSGSPRELYEAPLSDLLSSRSPLVRAAAGLSLGASEASHSSQQLLAWLTGERDGPARDTAVLVAGILAPPGVTEVLSAERFQADDSDLLRRVKRTLEGRSDRRLLTDLLEQRLREARARRIDRADQLLEELVRASLGMKEISRRVPATEAEGDGDGGGSSGEGPIPEAYRHRKFVRVDRRNSTVERDLEAWFKHRSYFGSWAERRERR